MVTGADQAVVDFIIAVGRVHQLRRQFQGRLPAQRLAAGAGWHLCHHQVSDVVHGFRPVEGIQGSEGRRQEGLSR